MDSGRSAIILLSRLDGTVSQLWRDRAPLPAVICAADDGDQLAVVAELESLGRIRPVLTGNRTRIIRVMKERQIRFRDARIIHCPDQTAAVDESVRMVVDREAAILVRGRLTMHDFLHAVLRHPRRREFIPAGQLLSHVAVFESPHFPRLILVSDGGVVIRPVLEQKLKIIENAVRVAHRLRISRPRVALLAAVETVTADMPASMEDAVIAKMAERGQIKNAEIDGPLSLDGALSLEAAAGKGIGGTVAGRADILIADRIEAGNAIYKALAVFGNSLAAGLLEGAVCPVVITSRSDSRESKLASWNLALMTAALSG